MQSIYYRSGKTAFVAVALGGLAFLCAMGWWSADSGKLGLAALVFGACAVLGMRNALNGKAALQFDSQRIIIDKLFGPVTLSWHDVQQIGIETFTLRYMGFIPVSKQQFLIIRADGGLFGSTNHRLAASALKLPAGGIAELCVLLTAMQVAAVGEVGVAMKGAGAQGWGAERRPARQPAATAAHAEPSSFDADAAIARYLAQKQAEAEAQLPAQPAMRPVRTFGRRAS